MLWGEEALALTTGLLWEGFHLVVATDGAASAGRHFLLRRAGSGIYIGKAHPLNRAIPLPGFAQTVPRAELYAVFRLLDMVRTVHMRILVDNEAVVRDPHALLSNVTICVFLGQCGYLAPGSFSAAG